MECEQHTIPADDLTVGRNFDIPYEHLVEFDFTRFPTADAFVALCRRHDLTNQDTVTATNPVDDSCSPHTNYHWYNDDVLLTTGWHPVTGERKDAIYDKEPGHAGRILLRGITDAVVPLYADIVETAAHIKGGEVREGRIQPDGTYVECEERFPDQLQAFLDAERQAIQEILDNR